MPAARLVVAKTAWDIAKSAGFTRFSESTRPSYDNSNPPSYIRRGSAPRRLTKTPRDALPAGLGGVQDPEEAPSRGGRTEPQSDGSQFPGNASQFEMVDVERTRIINLKALA